MDIGCGVFRRVVKKWGGATPGYFLYECANTGLISARVQKSEDGRKKTKKLTLQSFWRVEKSELEENARVRSWKTERAV
jgi:hypothetical protein